MTIDDPGNIFLRAGELMMQRGGASTISSDAAQALLARLQYDDASPSTAQDRKRRRGLLDVAAGLELVFELPSSEAPGIAFFGAFGNLRLDEGETRKVSFAGAGLHPRQAFQSCMGEAAECLSQIERRSDQRRINAAWPIGDFEPALRAQLDLGSSPPDGTMDMLEGTRLVDGARSGVPADLCLRRGSKPQRPTALRALSEGCAAGETRHHAMLGALLERIERDAAALWWIGGVPGRAMPDTHMIASGVTSLVEALYRRGRTRSVRFLDITTDLGVPCIAAFSLDKHGQRFACGLAARVDPLLAMRAAMMEMFAQELNFQIEDAQRTPGTANADQTDQRNGLDLADVFVLRPVGVSSLALVKSTRRPDQMVGQLALILAIHGIQAVAVDLTRRDIRIPVFQVLTPGLQPMTDLVGTDRLRRALEASGGGDLHRSGFKLL